MNEDYDNKMAQTDDSGAEHKAEPPIESKVVKKRSISRKIADALMSEDYRLIFRTIYDNIISPAIKKVAVEAFRAFVYRGKASDVRYDDYTDYGSFHDGSSSRGGEVRSKPSFGEIQFSSQQAAERCLDTMRNVLRKKGMLLVADYYKIAGQQPAPSYYDYCWTNLNSCYTYHYSEKGERKWGIHLPEPMVVENRN